MDHTVDLVPRKAANLVAEALIDTRVVALNGARQAGKSTLARLTTQANPGALIRLLDDPATLRAARDDPAGFVDHEGLLVIDEVQLAPELFRSIKVAVDTDPRPGRFLLTGSAQVLALRQLPDALPGRMEIVELWPFSQGEIDRCPDAFIDAVFAHRAADSPLRRPPPSPPDRRPLARCPVRCPAGLAANALHQRLGRRGGAAVRRR